MKTLFEDILGKSVETEVLQFFLEGRELDYCVTDLIEELRVDEALIVCVFNRFIKKQILVPTRIVGVRQLYTLNNDSEIVTHLIKIFDIVIDEKIK